MSWLGPIPKDFHLGMEDFNDECIGERNFPARKSRPDPKPYCHSCKQDAVLKSGVEIYPHRDDLGHIQMWVCDGCDSRVGCHPNSTNALGSLAGPELRRARILAHKAFDSLWKSGKMRRAEAYAWLSKMMGYRCHIGKSDMAVCNRIIKLVLENEEADDERG